MDKQLLEEEFRGQADWRREKAQEYPHDAERNLLAAEIFEQLAATVKDMPQEVLDASAELFEDLPDSEEWQEMLRTVGFHSAPANAEEFVRGFIAARTS